MNLTSKTLLPAQEAEIKRKLATASRLDDPAFARIAPDVGFFSKWFRQRYVAEPTPDKITPEVRAVFMPAWEKHLRDEADLANYHAELEAQEAADEERVQHDREDEDESDDDDDDDDAEAIAADIAPPIAVLDPDPTARKQSDAPAPHDPRPVGQRDGPDIKLTPRDPREPILKAWCDTFAKLPDGLQRFWTTRHRMQVVTGRGDDSGFLVVFLEPSEGVTIPDKVATHSTVARFIEYTKRTRRMLDRHTEAHSGRSLDDIEDDTETEYLIEGVVPAGALTVGYGPPKAGKSALAQLYTVQVAAKDLDVLFISADSGARGGQVKARLRQIMERENVSVNAHIRVVDSPVILDDPESVASLLEHNPGDFALVVIDPLYKCLSGDPSQPSVMLAAVAGLARIANETGAAVLVLHHQPKGGDARLYGSVFLDAALDSKVHVERDGDQVTVTVDVLKNDDAPEQPFRYTLEGAYLNAGAPPISTGTTERPDMLARLPTTWRPIKGTRALVEDLFSPKLKEKGRETLWRRLRAAWDAAKLIEQKDGTIRRLK